MNRSHTEIAGPSSRRVPRLIGMSFRSAIPGELHSCIARFRFADQNHSATNGAKCNRIQRKESVPSGVCLNGGVQSTCRRPVMAHVAYLSSYSDLVWSRAERIFMTMYPTM